MAAELRKLEADLVAAGAKAVPKVKAAVRKTALDIVASAKRHHLPNVDTAATINSIGADITETDTSITAVIGPTTPYSIYLEEGTRRMRAYPFMGPAADENIPRLEQAMEQIGGSILD